MEAVLGSCRNGIAIEVIGAQATILGNRIFGFRRGGILASSTGYVNVGVTGGGPQDPQPNLLDGASTAGTASAVKIRRTARGRISGNCIRGWGQSGIREDQHASVHASGNVVADSTEAGMSVTEHSVLTLTQDSEGGSIHNATNSHLLNGVVAPDGTTFFPCAGFAASDSDGVANAGAGIECINTSVISSANTGMTVGGTPNLVVGVSCFNDLLPPPAP